MPHSIGVATTARRRHRRILGGHHPGFEHIVTRVGNVDAKLGALVYMNADAVRLLSSGTRQGGLQALT
jgi:hypothetical protein